MPPISLFYYDSFSEETNLEITDISGAFIPDLLPSDNLPG